MCSVKLSVDYRKETVDLWGGDLIVFLMFSSYRMHQGSCCSLNGQSNRAGLVAGPFFMVTAEQNRSLLCVCMM